jgi:hypothetical protein
MMFRLDSLRILYIRINLRVIISRYAHFIIDIADISVYFLH